MAVSLSGQPQALGRAMDAAALFWFLAMVCTMVVFFAVMLLIGSIFGHQAVGGAVTPVFGLLLGVFAFAAANYGFAIVRSKYLSDGLIALRGAPWIQRWSVAASQPRLRDSMISLAAGMFVAVISSVILVQS
jgi:hypothetical protein